MKRYNIRLLVVCLLFILPSCAFHATNWQSNNPPGGNKAAFIDFRGRSVNRIKLAKNEGLLLSYSVGLTKGSLLLAVEKGHRKIWQKTFTAQPDSATLTLQPAAAGAYRIVVEGRNATGYFDLTHKAIAPNRIQVKVSKNIELFGLVMQLDAGAGLQNSTDSVFIENKKTTWRDWYAQTWKNYLRYKAFDSSELMRAYRDLSTKGVSDDFFIGFLLQVADVPAARITAETDPEVLQPFSKNGDVEEARKNAAAFLVLLNNFYNATRFGTYLQENKPYYDQVKAEVIKNLPSNSMLPDMEAFYRKSFNGYYLVPSLNIPTSMGFGKLHKATQTIYNAFGPFSFQSFDSSHLDLGFDYPDRIQGLSVHEFGHSFVNPAIDRVPKALVDSTTYLYTPIEAEMRKQAYISWTACLYEHFVRAGEVILARKQGRASDAEKLLQDNLKKSFKYLPAIVHELELYDNNRTRNQSYESVVPAIIRKLATAPQD